MTQPSASSPTVHLEPVPKAIVTALIMAATILVALDQTIANVALPHMQATLGATPDSIAWVLTSYILATAIATPITGWLAGRFGRVRLFGVAIIGFTISSALCGLSVSLPMMVAARLLQGLFGAFLLPMSQAFVYDINTPAQQMRALTIWAVGVMVAPMVGPMLGGFITENFDWRWVFFLNVPVGIVAAVGIFALMPQFPAARRAFDHIGFIIIAVALGGLQLALDRGTQQDWLDSPEIIIELGVSISAFWMLFFHLRRAKNPLIPIQLFQNRNFNGSIALSLVVWPIVLAGSALLPPLIQVLLGYPVMAAGMLMVPRGVAMTLGMMLSGRLMKSWDGRWLIAAGLGLIIAALWMQTGFNLQMDSHLLIWAGLLQGLGLGLAAMPTNYMTVATLPAALRTDGAACYSLVRNIGTSLMISLMSALLARNLQVNHAELGSALHASSMIALMPAYLGSEFTGAIAAMADAEVTRQAMMIAYVDDFWLMMWLAIAMIPLPFLLKPVRTNKDEPIEIIE